MSNMKRTSQLVAISALAFALTALAATENTVQETAEFKGDRRPGILEEPSDIPTGENAHLYDFLTKSFGEESVAEAPSSSGLSEEERYESAPTDPID
jgi:hypothetical protein